MSFVPFEIVTADKLNTELGEAHKPAFYTPGPGLAQSLPDDTDTVLNYFVSSINTFDPDGILPSSGTHTEVTVPEAGLWRVETLVRFTANATGHREVSFRVNAGAPLADGPPIPANTGENTFVRFARPFVFDANDIMEITARQDSGGSLNVLLMWLSMHLLARAA